MPKPKKTFKELVESNPITTLAVIAAAAVTSTFSLTSYFHGSEQKIRELEFQHQLSTQKESLDRQVAFLQGRLSSVERKLGSEASYLDVSTLITTPERTSSLGADFTYFKDLKCYISVPQNEKWTYEITTELKLLGYTFGASTADSVAKSAAGNALQQVPLHLWRGSGQFEVNTGRKDIPKLTLFPFVGIQSFDNAAIAQMLGETWQKSQEEEDQSLKAVRELSTKLESTSQQPSPGAKSEQSEIPKSSSGTRLAITDELSGIFRSDFAAFMLFGQLSGMFSFCQIFEGTSVQLLTAEKKGNLLYGHILLTFTDFQTKLPVFLDREIFFVSGPTRSFMLVTAAPSDDRRGRGSAWITSWLGSVRIPVE